MVQLTIEGGYSFQSFTSPEMSPVFYSNDCNALVSGFEIVTESKHVSDVAVVSDVREVLERSNEFESKVSYEVLESTLCFGSFNRYYGFNSIECLTPFMCNKSKFVGFVEYVNGVIGSFIVFIDVNRIEGSAIVLPVEKFLNVIKCIKEKDGNLVREVAEFLLSDEVEFVETVEVVIDNNKSFFSIKDSNNVIKSLKYRNFAFDELLDVVTALNKLSCFEVDWLKESPSSKKYNCNLSLEVILGVQCRKLFIGKDVIDVIKVDNVPGYLRFREDLTSFLELEYNDRCYGDTRLYKVVSRNNKYCKYYMLQKLVLSECTLSDKVIYVTDKVVRVINVDNVEDEFFGCESTDERIKEFLLNCEEVIYE